MALNGVRQLQKVTLRYCAYGGSSAGVRYDPGPRPLPCPRPSTPLTSPLSSLINSSALTQLRESNPHLEVVVESRPGRHPLLVGHYVDGSARPITLRNLAPQGPLPPPSPPLLMPVRCLGLCAIPQ